MPKFKYTGTDERHLAGVGDLKPNEVFSCTLQQGVALQQNSPELYELQPDETPVKKAAAVAPAKPAAVAPVKAEAPAPAKAEA